MLPFFAHTGEFKTISNKIKTFTRNSVTHLTNPYLQIIRILQKLTFMAAFSREISCHSFFIAVFATYWALFWMRVFTNTVLKAVLYHTNSVSMWYVSAVCQQWSKYCLIEMYQSAWLCTQFWNGNNVWLKKNSISLSEGPTFFKIFIVISINHQKKLIKFWCSQRLYFFVRQEICSSNCRWQVH